MRWKIQNPGHVVHSADFYPIHYHSILNPNYYLTTRIYASLYMEDLVDDGIVVLCSSLDFGDKDSSYPY